MLDSLLSLYNREPLVIRGVIVAFAAALASFGLKMTGAQIGSVWLLTEAVLTVISRASVYSPHAVRALKNEVIAARSAAAEEVTRP